MKPSIRKEDGRWVLTRPAFGFAPVDEVSEHDTWKAARNALLAAAPASAGASAERGYNTLALKAQGWSRRGTIRMEESDDLSA